MEVIDIESNASLTINETFECDFCVFRCANGSSIIIEGTDVVFSAEGSKFLNCTNELWKGIFVNAGTNINFNRCIISDAEKGLCFSPGYFSTYNELRATTFRNNVHGIYVGSNEGPISTLGFTVCYSNLFEGTNEMHDNTIASVALRGITSIKINLIFGSIGKINRFRNMRSGIKLEKGSYGWISNCEFENMSRAGLLTNTNINDPNTGFAIYSKESHLTIAKPLGFNACVFKDGDTHLVYVSKPNGPVSIKNAIFSGLQEYPLTLSQPIIPVPINISNNSFTIDQTSQYGMRITRPPGNTLATNTVISNNIINVPQPIFGPNEPNELVDFGPLVELKGMVGNAGNNKASITNNHLYSDNLDSYANQGIYVHGPGNMYEITNNYLFFTIGVEIPELYNNFSSLGISLENLSGSGNFIYNNTIRSFIRSVDTEDYPISNNARSALLDGIHIKNCPNITVCQNDIDSTYNGIHFSEMNLNTNYRHNIVRRHVHGSYFRKNTANGFDTDIDDQINAGNLWSSDINDYIDGGVGARYVDNPIVPFEFQYNPSTTIAPFPPSSTPMLSSWFVSNNGITPTSCDGNLSFTDHEVLIATDNYPYNTPAQNWDLHRYLCGKLLRNPGLEIGISELEDYLDGMKKSPTSPYLFAQSQFYIENAFYPDSSWQIKWDAVLGDINRKEGAVAAFLRLASLDTLAVNPVYADSLALAISTLTSYQDTLSILASIFASGRDVLLEKVTNNINTLPSDYDWEKAWIKILNIAIKYGRGYELDSADREDLLMIANACPASSLGIVVQESIGYLPHEDAVLFSGCKLPIEDCEEEEEERSAQKDTHREPAILFPNPANKQVTVQLLEKSTQGHWEIFDISGMLVSEGNWNTDQPFLQINILNLNNGFYFLRVEPEFGGCLTNKFSVIR